MNVFMQKNYKQLSEILYNLKHGKQRTECIMTSMKKQGTAYNLQKWLTQSNHSWNSTKHEGKLQILSHAFSIGNIDICIKNEYKLEIKKASYLQLYFVHPITMFSRSYTTNLFESTRSAKERIMHQILWSVFPFENLSL